MAEVLGNINPLKVIETLITNWRYENTLREQNRIDGEILKEAMKAFARLEELRIYSNLANSLRPDYDQIAHNNIDSEEKFVVFMRGSAENMLHHLAQNNHIQDVSAGEKQNTE